MRRVLEFVLVAAGCLAALFFAAVGAFYLSTSGLVRAADGFLGAVRDGDLAAATRFASEDFAASASADELRAALESNGLARLRRASWASRSLALGGRGGLDGVGETDDGRSVPLHVTLVKEGGAWKVQGLARQAAGLLDLAAPAGAPGPAEQLALVRGSVSALGAAARSGDFGPFHAGVARLWRAQVTADGLKAALAGTPEGFGQLASLTPELLGPPTLDGGVLVVQVRYQLGTGRTHVRCKYVREGLSWKLVGIAYAPKPLED